MELHLQTGDFSYLTFVALQAALQAGDILRKGFGNSHHITAKDGKQNIVTECDYASEKKIISILKEAFPDHSILAEESGLQEEQTESICWIIDPLDGTFNFSRRIPIFVVSIAAYKNNEPICGIIFHPLTYELFIAEKGKGAFLNGERLKISSVSSLDEAMIGAGFPFNAKDNPGGCIDHLAEFTRKGVTLRNLGSAALNLAYVAAGKLDAFWLNNLYPWDLAAGQLLVQEAGGIVTNYSGKKPLIHIPSSVIASNGHLHQEMQQALGHFCDT